MYRTARHTMTLATLAGLALLALACSNQNPMSSSAQTTRGISSLTSMHDTEFEATLATTDPVSRSLTFSDSPEQVVVAPNAEIKRSNSDGSGSVSITFADLQPGDHVRIRGNRQPDQSVLADNVEVQVGEDRGEDDDFKSTIVTIDYLDSSFTVASRTETIRVDANTRILGHVRGGSAAPASDGGHDDGWSDDGRDTAIAFANLIVGDSVEVHVQTIDAGTLLALVIELEDEAENEALEVEFKDHLATVDVSTGTVTFQVESWVGTVAADAELLDLDNNPVNLSAFAPGQLVEVKGMPQPDNTLLISRLRMDNN